MIAQHFACLFDLEEKEKTKTSKVRTKSNGETFGKISWSEFDVYHESDKAFYDRQQKDRQKKNRRNFFYRNAFNI